MPKKSTYYEEILNAVYKKVFVSFECLMKFKKQKLQLGWVPEENLKKDSLEDYVCNSSMPFIFIAISFAFYVSLTLLNENKLRNVCCSF